MRYLGTVLIFIGIMLMGLSGLEKVIIFTSFNGTVHGMQTVINLTPSEIWTITIVTFWSGLLLFIIGCLYMYLNDVKKIKFSE